MDYLDPQKQRRHTILLFVGYILITIAIVAATLLLVYQAYGFGIDRNGTVIQNGIVFVSSQPNPATITINDKKARSQTNARLALPANKYQIRLSREGYTDWTRNIDVSGGSVTHYDYPLLLPKTVQTTSIASLTGLPALATQSPDRRWLLLSTDTTTSFKVYDLKNPAKAATTLDLADTIVSKATTSERWQFVEWASDNDHVLLQHTYDDQTEFIMIDRENPEESRNLNQFLNSSPSTVTLIDKKYDQYYLYSATDKLLQTASLRQPELVTAVRDVLTYKSYGDDTILYVTDADAPANKVLLKLQTGSQTKILRSFATSPSYLVDLATYKGTPYVIASATAENKVYIYKDPLAQLSARPAQVIVPQQVLRVTTPDYESFSSSAQFVMVQHVDQIAVYDFENKNGYNYTLTGKNAPLDAPQTHASWMDGNRLTYVSGGKLQILDYDQTNQRAFVNTSSTLLPFFAPDYRQVYTIIPNTSGATLSSTALRTEADQ